MTAATTYAMRTTLAITAALIPAYVALPKELREQIVYKRLEILELGHILSNICRVH
jgi:hypothetical protein